MYGRKKKILVKSSGGSCSLIFEHSNNNLTSGLTTPSLTLLNAFSTCVSFTLLFSVLYMEKKTSNSNIVRLRYVSALRTRKTGLASCWTRLEADQTGWGGMFLLAFCMMTSFLLVIIICHTSYHYWQIVVGPHQTGQIRLAGVESVC